MKIAKPLLLALACTGLAAASTINIQVSQGANQATNFAGYNGSVSNGLVWGLIISTTDTNFSPIQEGFQLGTSLAGTLIPGTDDYVIMSPVVTNQGTQGDIANPGKIGVLNAIQINDSNLNNIVPGNRFAIIWFDSTVTSPTALLTDQNYNFVVYGIMSNPSWVIPTPGVTQNISSFFAGSPDPVKLADDVIVITPEPGSLLLGMVGALSLLRRRRRK